MLTQKKCDMTKGNILTQVVAFSLPLFIGYFLQQFYNMVDTAVVGRFVGKEALAAVGLSGQPLLIVTSLFLGIGTGASILISQEKGKGNVEEQRKITRTACSFVFLATLPAMALGFLGFGPLLQWIKVPLEVYPLAKRYLWISTLGILGTIGYNMNAGILRGLGDSRAPLLFVAISSLENAFLDFLFVACFHWGVAGVAWGTVISIYTSWAVSVFWIRKKEKPLGLTWFPREFSGKILLRMVKLGVPVGLNNTLFAIGHVFYSVIINAYGTAMISAYTAISNLNCFNFFPAESFAITATTFAGQTFGAGQTGRLKEGTKKILTLSVIFSLIISALLFLFGGPMLGLFTEDTEVVELGKQMLYYMEPLFVLYPVMGILHGCMNGMGKVIFSTINNMIVFWIFRLPSAYLLSKYWTGTRFILSYPISWGVGALGAGLYFFLKVLPWLNKSKKIKEK